MKQIGTGIATLGLIFIMNSSVAFAGQTLACKGNGAYSELTSNFAISLNGAETKITGVAPECYQKVDGMKTDQSHLVVFGSCPHYTFAVRFDQKFIGKAGSIPDVQLNVYTGAGSYTRNFTCESQIQ